MPKSVPMRFPRSLARTAALLLLPAAAFALRSADLSGIRIFPADNYWYWDISKFPVHPNSAHLVASAGNNTPLHPDFGSVLDGAPFESTGEDYLKSTALMEACSRSHATGQAVAVIPSPK